MFRCIIVVILAIGLATPAKAKAEATASCPGQRPIIHIDTRAHRLHLCEKGRPIASYRVAIGSAGTPKRKQGDKKTPIGRYGLGKLRPSARYRTFIPVEYPTAEQSAQGYTGSLIGIHGPKRVLAWAGRWSTYVDWTQGCIAVGSDDEIDAIASWLGKAKPVGVVID